MALPIDENKTRIQKPKRFNIRYLRIKLRIKYCGGNFPTRVTIFHIVIKYSRQINVAHSGLARITQ